MLMLACRPSVQPQLPEGLKSGLLIGPAQDVEAIDGDHRTQTVFAKDTPQPLLLGYESSLDDLFLESGPLGVLLPPAGRPLPLADWYLELDRSDEGLGWTDSSSALELTAPLRLPTISPDACASAGGCYPSDAAREVGDCRRTCSTATPMAPSPPESPLPPTFPNCPTEWSSEPSTCRAPAIAPTCPLGEWQTFAASGCVPMDQCPAGPFRGLADVHVDGQATAPHDGTELHPYRTLAEALQNGGAAKIIALAPGSYQAESLPPGTRLVGHCASTTVLVGAFDTTGAVELSHLRLESRGEEPGAEVTSGILQLSSVDADFTGTDAGVLVQRLARFFVHDSKIRSEGVAVRAVGGVVEANASVFETEGLVGIDVVDGTLRLSRVRARSAGDFTHARNSQLEVDVAVVDSGGAGIIGVGDSNAILSQLDLRAGGVGIDLVESDGDVSASRVSAARGRGLSVDRGILGLSDVVINDVSAEAGLAIGISARASNVDIRRVEVHRVAGSGLSLSGDLVVEDLRVEEVDRREGHLLMVPQGATSRLQLRRAFLGAGAGGLQVEDSAEATIESLDVHDISGGVAPLRAAVYVGDGPRAELRRVRITEAPVYGLWIYGREHARQVSDLQVRGAGTGVRFPSYSTTADEASLSTTMMSRVEVQDSAGLGFCVGRGWRVRVDHLKVSSTGDSVLADCVGDDRGGIGLVVGGASDVFLDVFDIHEAKIGAFVQTLAGLEASDGRFSELDDALVAPGKSLSDFLVKITYRNVERVGP